jgi:hypothetical protein
MKGMINMFTEIENELLHIISEDPKEKVAYFPNNKAICKLVEALCEINSEDVERMYITGPDNTLNVGNITLIVRGNEDTFFNTLVVNGVPYKVIIIYTARLNKEESSAEKICDVISNYTGIRITTLLEKYVTRYDSTINQLMSKGLPVIVCSIMRKLYQGELLPKIVSKSLQEFGGIISEECITSIFKLLDDGFTVFDLLDNSLICSIHADDKNYPGIWEKEDK